MLQPLTDLAKHAAAVAIDTPAHQPRASELRLPLSSLIKPESLTEAWTSFLEDGPGDRDARVVDGLGHARPEYVPLAVDVLRLAGRTVGTHLPALDVGTGAASGYLAAALGEPVDPPAASGAMQPADVDAAPDTWVFEDLIWLHALHRAGRREERVAEAVAYHVEHTQPDYTTYQPWAIGAFATAPGGASFAEQQLHDVRTHLSIEGGAGAVVIALLLRLAVDGLGKQ